MKSRSKVGHLGPNQFARIPSRHQLRAEHLDLSLSPLIGELKRIVATIGLTIGRVRSYPVSRYEYTHHLPDAVRSLTRPFLPPCQGAYGLNRDAKRLTRFYLR